ncbi:MAG TPA: response regulator [Caulobacteraceae bacterium]|nr:response regulator [Caulobacteraceae bacterium]
MAAAFRFILADDDADVLTAAAAALAALGAASQVAGDPHSLIAAASQDGFDAALLDMNFAVGARSGAEGLALLDRLRGIDPALSVVLMTTWGGVALAVEGLKRGAADFVLKPWRNEALARVMGAAAERTRARRLGGAALNLDELERHAIARALELYEGNVSHAAAALGITRPALYRRIARHGL